MFSRRGGHGGRSKATPNTTCQKCLQKGHYSYECTVSAQERPYKPRPSRTQQLLNPSLKPKLTEDVPKDLLRKKGLADKILAEKEEERRKRSGRRSPSASSVSDSDSVSTISTNRSLSRSRSPRRIKSGSVPLRGDLLGKRGRRSISSESHQSPDGAERNTRRRLSSMSPEHRGRGRRRSRSRASPMDISHDEGSQRKATRKHYSHSRSYTKGRGGRRSRSRSRRAHGKRSARPSLSRSLSRSPNRLDRMDTSDDRIHPQNGLSPIGRPVRASRSRSRSPHRRRSPSPYSKRRTSRSPSPYKDRNNGMNGNNSRGGGRHRFDTDARRTEPVRAPAPQPAPPRERSLSPYSKRVALTRQMQGGR